jgi:hypothetical protein
MENCDYILDFDITTELFFLVWRSAVMGALKSYFIKKTKELIQQSHIVCRICDGHMQIHLPLTVLSTDPVQQHRVQ